MSKLVLYIDRWLAVEETLILPSYPNKTTFQKSMLKQQFLKVKLEDFREKHMMKFYEKNYKIFYYP